MLGLFGLHGFVAAIMTPSTRGFPRSAHAACKKRRAVERGLGLRIAGCRGYTGLESGCSNLWSMEVVGC
jgi:hypothetical protein